MNEVAGKIQESELEVMHVLWGSEGALPLSVIRIVLHDRCSWEDSTVKTLLRRLQAKGAVELVSRGQYRAVLTESEYNEWASHRMIDRLYHGSAKNLVASLVNDGSLSQEDIAELRAFLEEVGGCD